METTRLYKRWQDGINNTSSFFFACLNYLDLYCAEQMPDLHIPFEKPKAGTRLLDVGREWLRVAELVPERNHFGQDWMDALAWIAVYSAVSGETLDGLLPDEDAYILQQSQPDLKRSMPMTEALREMLIANFLVETRYSWSTTGFDASLIQRQTPAKNRVLAIVIALTDDSIDLTFSPTLLSHNIFLTEEQDRVLIKTLRPSLRLPITTWMGLLPARLSI